MDINSVVVGDRVRKDYGNVDELCDSIKAVGLIQPIVLTHDLQLVVGGRRFSALTRLGVKELIHASHFIWTEEVDEIRLKAIEAEENLKRKALTWVEEVKAKKRLLDLMQQIHGIARSGHPSRSDSLGITSEGFGINKLANLLGESNAQTSKDVELASLIESVPQLALAETKEAARRQAQLAVSVAIALQQQKTNPPKTEQKWTLYEGDFVDNVNNLEPSSIDLVITDPPFGDDSAGMGPNSKPLIASPFVDSLTATAELLSHLTECSYKVLRQDKFALTFFSFSLYSRLVDGLISSGFALDLVPLIWVKNTVINTSPYTRYGRSYEPILVARKGEPKLMRPSQRDVIQVDNTNLAQGKVYQAQKPVALIEKLILDLCPPGGTVVDLCAGSGTTGEAAIKTGRRAVLFERDPVACQIIRARLGAL